MKCITLPPFVFAAGLFASSLFTACPLPAAQDNPAHPPSELSAIEIQKAVYLFGTPAQKLPALEMVDLEFQGIGYSAPVVGRHYFFTKR